MEGELSPEEAAQLALEEIAHRDIPEEDAERVVRAVLRGLCEKGCYDVVAAILRRRQPEHVVYERLMHFARDLGHNESLVFEAVWGNFG